MRFRVLFPPVPQPRHPPVSPGPRWADVARQQADDPVFAADARDEQSSKVCNIEIAPFLLQIFRH